MPRRGNKREGTIDGHSAEGDAASARDLTRSPGDVGEAGSDVEESGAWLVASGRWPVARRLDDLVEQRPDGEHDSAAAAEEDVGARHVPMRALPHDGRDVWIVEKPGRSQSHFP